MAHELALVWRGTVYSLDAQHSQCGDLPASPDPLPVDYKRQRLRCIQFGRLMLPLPSHQLLHLLRSKQPLHGHLPSPGVLLTLCLAKLVQPRRLVSVHWHAFLESRDDSQGWLYQLYQWVALKLLFMFSEVVTTSPVLERELMLAGCSSDQLRVLPCCLEASFESEALDLPLHQSSALPMRVLFIGRLDSYKRLDWLVSALSELDQPWQLNVVGDGPLRDVFEAQAAGLPVLFHGRVDEKTKLDQLAFADVLVLPSDRSNEAFGIVQLEAMAAGVPALAFARQRSGMAWVSSLPALPWSQRPEHLSSVLMQLAGDAQLRFTLSTQARERYQCVFSRDVWLSQLNSLKS